MLFKNMRATVCSTNGDINFFEMVVGVLQGHTLTPYLFVICFEYVLQMLIDLMKENDFILKKDKQMISHRNYDRYRLCR